MAALDGCGLRGAAAVFSDGVRALEHLHGGDPPPPMPALVMLDLMLPMLSGLEVLERIRKNERTALIPTAIFTSSNNPDDIDRAYKLGANSYVRKPMNPKEFDAAVVELARYWTERNIPASPA